jgi:bile acid:Na+ symporter, BASS family
MDPKQLILLALQLAILGTVFSFGLKSTREDVLYLVHRPGLLLRSLCAVLVVMPILAVAFVKVFDFPMPVEIVLVALAVSPVPPLLPKRETKAGGRPSYGLGLMLVLAVVAIGTMPLAAELLSRVFERPLVMGPGAIARIVVTAVVLPFLAGMVVHKLWPRSAERLAKPVRLVASALLALAIVALLAGTWQAIWGAIGSGAVLAIVIFVVAGMLVGHVLGGPDPEHAAVLALSTGCRHPAIALAFAATNYPGEHFGGTILLYLLVSILVGMPYIAWQRRRLAASPT